MWNAITGEIRQLNEYKEENGRTLVPITCEPYESWFIVFTNQNGIANDGYVQNFPAMKETQKLDGAWEVDFKNKAIGPEGKVAFNELSDWISSDDDIIKYYSGTATYTTTFNYEKKASVKDVFIDLGKVGVMATVKLNGQVVGTAWMAPYKLNVSDYITNGENTLEIDVVNVWRNRITGDKQLSDEEKTTWLVVDGITPEEELISSGLIGPVTINETE